MYIQITTRCNMECEHCCYSCTNSGEDMSMEVYKAALAIVEDFGGYIALGGGEPTIHPKFWEFMGLALGSNAESIWLATNGKKTETAIALSKMARKGVIGCALSQDAYHDEIDEVIIRAFTRDKRKESLYQANDDQREIRNVNNKELNAGRCDFGTDGCVCPESFVKPNGDIYQCGCEDSPKIGNVFSGLNPNLDIDDDYEIGTCYKEYVKFEVMAV